jgi:hypothetical protein
MCLMVLRLYRFNHILAIVTIKLFGKVIASKD